MSKAEFYTSSYLLTIIFQRKGAKGALELMSAGGWGRVKRWGRDSKEGRVGSAYKLQHTGLSSLLLSSVEVSAATTRSQRVYQVARETSLSQEQDQGCPHMSPTTHDIHY